MEKVIPALCGVGAAIAGVKLFFGILAGAGVLPAVVFALVILAFVILCVSSIASE
jgi:hypothetical protein